MPNEVTITVSLDSPTNADGVVGGNTGTSPSPLPIDQLGVPADTAGLVNAQPSGQEPAPLDQLPAESPDKESGPPVPAPFESQPPAGQGGSPAPLPLDELLSDRTDASVPPEPQQDKEHQT